MNKTLLFAILLFSVFNLKAQDAALAPDQNPRYKESLDKYVASKDELQKTNNTTVQDTYKAYDWYQAKMDRRQDRINYRRQMNLYRRNNYYPYDNYYNGYDHYRNNNYRYNNRGNNNRHYNYQPGCSSPFGNWFYWFW
ncbi:MAG: hypothetical protein WAT19_08960 [Ferruginibacter sp.]